MKILMKNNNNILKYCDINQIPNIHTMIIKLVKFKKNDYEDVLDMIKPKYFEIQWNNDRALWQLITNQICQDEYFRKQ